MLVTVATAAPAPEALIVAVEPLLVLSEPEFSTSSVPLALAPPTEKPPLVISVPPFTVTVPWLPELTPTLKLMPV